VLDIVPITDFPNIRMRCAIYSTSSGTVVGIPRENKLVRLYIQLTTTKKGDGKKVDRSKITYRYSDWWTAYQIGQRVGNSFSLRERVFGR
jgi:phenol 2-monooxygenase